MGCKFDDGIKTAGDPTPNRDDRRAATAPPLAGAAPVFPAPHRLWFADI